MGKKSREEKLDKEPGTPEVSEARNLRGVFIIIILAVSILVYINTLYNGFVYDDNHQVLKNRWIVSFENIPEVLTSSAWGFSKDASISNYYRPVMHLAYMIDYRIFGLSPWGYHLTNILVHGANSVLIFVLASFLLKGAAGRGLEIKEPLTRALLPLCAALFFAAQPINTESVAWVAGIPELTYTFFYLLSFYFYIRNTGGYSFKSPYYTTSIIIFFISTICKETALTLPAFLLAYDLFVRKDISIRTPLMQWVKRYLPFAAVAALYLMIRMYALQGFAPRTPWHMELTTFQHVINIPLLLTKYFYKLLLPMNLSAFHVLHPALSLAELKLLASFLFSIGLLALIWRLRSSIPLVSFLILWIIIPLLPVLYIPVVGENTFTERYLYLPSAGFSVLLSIALYKLFKLGSRDTAVPIVAAAVLITGAYSTGTIKRNPVWFDDITLWTDTVKKSPDGAFAQYNLGFAYYKKGRLDEAIRQYRVALDMKFYMPDWHYDLGLAYHDKGMLDKAIFHYREAIRYSRVKDANTHNNLGNALAKKGLLEEAIAEYEEALRIDPGNEFAMKNLNIVKRMLGK